MQREITLEYVLQTRQIQAGKDIKHCSGDWVIAWVGALQDLEPSTPPDRRRRQEHLHPGLPEAMRVQTLDDAFTPAWKSPALSHESPRSQRALHDGQANERVRQPVAKCSVGEEYEVLSDTGWVVKEFEELGSRRDRVVGRSDRRAVPQSARKLPPLQRPFAADQSVAPSPPPASSGV